MARVGAAPISWGACEIPGWGNVLPWSLVLDQMRDAGYLGSELGPPDYLPADSSKLSAALQSRGLTLAAAFLTLRFSEPEQIAADLTAAEATAALLHDLGADRIVVADAGNERRLMLAGDVTPADGLTDDQWRTLADTLARFADTAAARALHVAFHPHVGSYVETRAEIERLCAMTDPAAIGLCLDTGHLAFGGSDPLEVARTYASRINHVHVKDVVTATLKQVRHEHAGFREAVRRGVFTELGRGDLDLGALRGCLADAAYDGWYIVEQDVRLAADADLADLLARARRNRDAVRALFGA